MSFQISDHIFSQRIDSKSHGAEPLDEFYHDHSRIVFCSSFRRMMQKAQVFSLETNTSVRNRLTHSLEVSNIGRTLARRVGRALEAKGCASEKDTECMQVIVENACLIHDIGNPPFGHFGEEAIKKWFRNRAPKLIVSSMGGLSLEDQNDPRLADFRNFDGNPQGFRIVTRLHSELGPESLGLTNSTLLASVKYPNVEIIEKGALFDKKIGIFSSERPLYASICDHCGIRKGRRYFLAYLMELADDICYCLSDIADSFEKQITTSREFKEEFGRICKEKGVSDDFIPDGKIENFSNQVANVVSARVINEAAEHFSLNIVRYTEGAQREILESLPSGKILECFKIFARKFIYTDREAERIEIAGSRIVEGLLEHFGGLLAMSREDFQHFVEKNEMRKKSGLDTEWRIFHQLSKRMVAVYKLQTRGASDSEEWICRARLLVDYISGLTDNSALRVYQNFMGISL